MITPPTSACSACSAFDLKQWLRKVDRKLAGMRGWARLLHMADPVAPKSQPPLGKKRAVQRCPNCDIRCDVSLFVDGSLARCGHCGVRFEVHREKSAPPAQPP